MRSTEDDPNARGPGRDGAVAPLAEACAWLGVALVVFSLGFWPLRASHDEWWHLKTGQWIAEHGFRPPAKDVFTYTAAAYDWDNHEWLSETLMFLIWRWGEERVVGGWRAVILAKALLLAATYLLLGRFLRQRAGPGAYGLLVAVFLTLVAAAAGRKTFWPRPPVVSYFFMTFFLYVLWLHRSGRLATPWLFALPVLTPLWANLHGGFLLGGVVVGAYFAGELAEWAGVHWIARRDASAKRFRAMVYLGVGLLCGLGSLLTPFGYKLYLLTSRVMSNKDLVSRLSELLPPDFRFTWAYAFLLLLLGVGFAALIARTLLRKPTPWPPAADVLLVAFFFWQSIHHVRHLPLFGLAGAPLAAWMLREFASGCSRSADGGRRAPWSRRGLLTGALAAASAVCAVWLVFLPGEAIGVARHLRNPQRYGLAPSSFEFNLRLLRGEDVAPGDYPMAAVQFILSARLPGRMYNRNNISGYLIWALSPEHYKVFTDSRFDVFGGDFLMDELSIAKGAESAHGERLYLMPYRTPLRDWRAVVDAWRINWMILERGEEVNRTLARPGSGWALIYADPGYAIWLKRTPGNRPWIDKYEIPPVGRPAS